MRSLEANIEVGAGGWGGVGWGGELKVVQSRRSWRLIVAVGVYLNGGGRGERTCA